MLGSARASSEEEEVMESLFQVWFRATDRRRSLLAARRFVNALAGGVTLERGENVRLDGAVYVTVYGQEASVNLALQEVDMDDVVCDADPTVAFDGIECVNCGNRADGPFVRCPACEFVEISACPNCGTSNPRSSYPSAEGDLLRCPACDARVRLAYHDPMWQEDGRYSEPLIHVRRG
jgi:hypothetical protein